MSTTRDDPEWVPAPDLGGDNADAFRAQLDPEWRAEVWPGRHGWEWSVFSASDIPAAGHVGKDAVDHPRRVAMAAAVEWHQREHGLPEPWHERCQRYAALELLALIRAEAEAPDGSWNGGDVVQLLTADWFPRHGIDIEEKRGERR
jgi:hypothetical protein